MTRLKKEKSFTLVEMLLAASILAFAACGILTMYGACLSLIATSKNASMATSAAQGLMEEIRSTAFSVIAATYNNMNFSVNNMPPNRGVVYVDETDPELLRITISVSWRQGNRIIGGDTNLNGIADAGEATNADGTLYSPVQFVTLRANR